MPHHGTPFPYPRLPVGVDAIRVLIVKPGNFFDPLVCTLVPAAFSDRPKYVALSYSWGGSYPDNTNLPLSPNDARPLFPSLSTSPGRLRGRLQTPPTDCGQGSTNQRLTDVLPQQQTISSQTATTDPVALMLNDRPFQVGHNLHLALLHLRSPTHPIAAWVDAICINQGDTEERNQQVSLMSFIYMRAARVVAWLGTKDYRSMADQFRSMTIEWKAGQTRHFAAFLAGASKMRCSAKPDQGTFVRITESTYWKRLWVVQEVCLPLLLVLVYGSEIWTYEEFRQWDFLPAAGQSLPQAVSNGCGTMLRLFETRDKRHTDMMTLESLIERFTRSECSELRDKVYGLLGCANDIHPFAGQDERADSLKYHQYYFNTLSTGLEPLSKPRRGIGSLRVDYSCSFYDIWTSVVGFVFFQAKNVEGRVYMQAGSEAREQTVAGQVAAPLDEERRISIVRMASIVQDALGQRVEAELASPENTAVSGAYLGRISGAEGDQANHVQKEQDLPVIRAVGYIAGEIVRLGPDYRSLVASSRAQQDWTSCWVYHCEKAEDLEMLRRINEQYTAKILDYEERDVDRIRAIRNPSVIAWRVAEDSHRFSTSNSSYAAEYEMMWVDIGVDEQRPRICLGTDHVIGLVPQAARLGDVIVRFWNCSAAIVMRPIKSSMTETGTQSFMLVGRADVAEVIDRKTTPGRDKHAEQRMSGTIAPGVGGGSQHSGAVYVDLKPRTLQIITAYIAT